METKSLTLFASRHFVIVSNAVVGTYFHAACKLVRWLCSLMIKYNANYIESLNAQTYYER